MTNEEHYARLPNPYATWAIQAMVAAGGEQGLSQHARNLSVAIMTFSWNSTPQGGAFWDEINTQLVLHPERSTHQFPMTPQEGQWDHGGPTTTVTLNEL